MKLGSWIGDLQSKVLNPFREAATPRLQLGAFGKHPGWDDHMDDIGLVTAALLTAKQMLYVDGVGKIIDSSAWDNLAETERLPGFDHLFFWFGAPDLLAGRIWSSSDRKGRTKYPLVVCVQMQNVEPSTALPWVVTQLAQIEKEIRATEEAEKVKADLGDWEVRLRDQLSALSIPARAEQGMTDALRQMRKLIGDEGMCRAVHGIDSQLTAFKTNAQSLTKIDSAMSTSKVLPQHVRLPTDSNQPVNAMLFWWEWFQRSMAGDAPMLFIQPPGKGWVDVIVGPPTMKELFCLRASPAAIPLSNEVPFNISVEFRQKVIGKFEVFAEDRL